MGWKYPGALLILVCTAGFACHADKNTCLPAIVDYHPTPFEFKASKPFYYIKQDGKLYFSPDGRLDAGHAAIRRDVYPHTWEAMVSPDSQYILIYVPRECFFGMHDRKAPGTMMLLSRTGERLAEFPAESPLGDRTPDVYRCTRLQWAPDSKSFLVLKNGKGTDFKKTAALYRYDIRDRTMRKFCDVPFNTYAYYLSRDGRYLYTILKNRTFGRMETAGPDHPEIIALEKLDREKDRVFVNFKPYQDFGDSGMQYSCDLRTLMLSHHGEDAGVYIFRDRKLARLWSIMPGHDEIKSCPVLVNLNHCCFLPGDRYFVIPVETRNYSGDMVVDAWSGTYMQTGDGNVRIFFSLTTADCPNIKLNANFSGLTPDYDHWNPTRTFWSSHHIR